MIQYIYVHFDLADDELVERSMPNAFAHALGLRLEAEEEDLTVAGH